MKNLVIITIIWLVSGMLLANLTDDLAEVQAEFDVIGMSVLVLDENSTEFSYYGGLSDIERQIPISVETKYRIASISKLITATAVMQLWEDNLLELNTDISEYLDYEVRNPHYPQQPITLKQLMTHTSSLRDSDAYFNFLYDSYGTSNPPNLKELLTENGVYYAENLWSYKAPGETDNWSYCNLGAGILATIVEKISGQHFQEYCRQNFFEPLQIDACWQDLENLEDINYLAVLYRYNQQGTAIPQADNYGGQLPPSINWEAIPVGHNGICYAPQGGTPFIIVYKTSAISYFLGKHLVKIDKIGLPNIIMQDKIVPELIQQEAAGSNIASWIKKYLLNPTKYAELKKSLQKLHQIMEKRSASQETAKIIEEMLV